MTALPGVYVADDPVMTASPTWTELIGDEGVTVTGWSTNRGRSYELAKTGTGTATIDIVDKNGAFDPTQVGSLLVDVMHHAKLTLVNPVDTTEDIIFRGFVDSIAWSPFRTTEHANVRIELVDAMAVLAAAEMTPDGTFGDSVDDGNIVFDALDFTDAVQRRIGDVSSYGGVLDQVGWPTLLRRINTGNVWLQSAVYAPRTSVLTVILDAADAEHPVVANFYVAKDGYLVFTGRLPRFDPVSYSTPVWVLGDDAAALVDPTNTVRISPPVTIYRDTANLYTSAIALPKYPPQGVLTSAEIAGQYVTDAPGVTAYGLRTWSADSLLTGAEDTVGSTTELEATKLFADYIASNYAAPLTRVGEITVRPKNPDGPNGTPTWAFFGGVEIGDVVEITTSHFGYQAFNGEPFFVEGIRYDVRPASGDFPDVTCSLDVSPAGYFGSNPFV